MRSFLFAVLILCNISYASTGEIKGSVSDSKKNTPLKGVNVICSDPRFSTTSDAGGDFIIKNIPVGKYSFSVSHIGFEIHKLELTVSNEPININITLAPTSIELGEILIVSLKNFQLQRTASAPLEVIDSKKIEVKTAVSVPDLLKQQAGLSLSRDGIWGTNISIRGLSRSNIVTLIDGNRIETATDIAAGFSLFNLADIDRIEVIKGAASALYGTGALGGVVNIISKTPFYNKDFSLSGSFSGEYNGVNNGKGASLSLSASNDFMIGKLSLGGRNAGDTKTPSGNLNNSGFEDHSISALLGFKLHNNHEMRLNYHLFRGDDIGIPGASAFFPGTAVVKYDLVKRDLFSAEYLWKNISSSLMKMSLKYFTQNIRRDVDNIPNTPTTGTTTKSTVKRILPSGRHYTQGIQLQSDWMIASNNYLVAGIDFWLRNLDSRRTREIFIDTQTADTTRIFGEKPIPEATFKSAGIFVQDEIILPAQNLSFTIGGRYDFIEVSNSKTMHPVYVINNGVINYSPADQKVIWKESKTNNKSWSGNLGMLYKVTGSIDVTLNVAKSFRSPSLEERYQYIDQGATVPLRVGNPDLKPEHGFFNDLGFRIWKPKFTLRTNLFANYLNDLVSEKDGTFDNRVAKIKTNVGKARLVGFDFDAEGEVYQSLVVYSVVSFVEGRDIEKGVPLPQMPPLNGRLGFRYSLFEMLTADFATLFFAKQNKVAASEFATPGYVTVDFSLSTKTYKLGMMQYRFTAGAENILDKSYRNHLATNRGFITIEPGRNIFAKIYCSW